MIGVILPLAAIVIAVLVVIALWLWWSGSEEAEAVTQDNSHKGIELGGIPNPPIPTNTTSSVWEIPPMQEAPVTNELLRVLQTQDDNIAVIVGGRIYSSLQEMKADPAVESKFLHTARAIAKFAEDAENILNATAAPTPSTTPIRAATTLSVSNSQTLSAEEQSAAEAEAQTVAGQIERFLQERLAGTPEMAGRSIHIHSSPSGGVQIMVDDGVFESVEDITDSSARSVIEAAIRDWETTNPI